MYVQEVLEAILEIYFKISKPSQTGLIVTEKRPTNPPVNESAKKAQNHNSKAKIIKSLGTESCWERCRKVRNLHSTEKPNACHMVWYGGGKKENATSLQLQLSIYLQICARPSHSLCQGLVCTPQTFPWVEQRQERAGQSLQVGCLARVSAGCDFRYSAVSLKNDVTVQSCDDVFCN